jgi:hypothetical protein
MDALTIITRHPEFKILYSNQVICVGNLLGSNVYFRIVRKEKIIDELANLYDVSWYHKSVDNKDLESIHLVDILNLVKEEISEDLIFNMSLFLNKGV